MNTSIFISHISPPCLTDVLRPTGWWSPRRGELGVQVSVQERKLQWVLATVNVKTQCLLNTKTTVLGVEQLTYSGEFKLSPSVVRSLPRARWTIPGSVSAARINVNRPIMPNWSVTIPEGMFVTRPAAAAAWIIQSAANLWDWTVILCPHLLSIHYLQFYTTLCAHIEARSEQFIVFDRWRRQTD